MREPDIKERVMRAFRHVLLAGKSLVNDDVSLPIEAFNSCVEKESWITAQESKEPLGCFFNVVERRYTAFEHADWRHEFAKKLSGKGLEIGALHRPLATHDKMDMDYADRLSLEDLRKHYPELAKLNVVSPNIISDAETLQGVGDNTYDFLVSAHLIEHMRDPIGAIKTWARVVRPGGLLYLIVPDKRGSFDCYRSRTALEHMILDYREPSEKRDFAHYVDYSVLVHSKEGKEALADAKKLVEEEYSIHFHVFMPSDVLDLVNWMSDNVLPLEVVEGPAASPGSDEFHLLIKVGQ